jgi:hypothetical protein
MQQELRSTAHDLMNLVARLGFLSENLKREIGSDEARSETTELLADTIQKLSEIAERLRKIGDEGADTDA